MNLPAPFVSLAKAGIRALSLNWKPYSRLILAGDNAGWVLDWEMHELRNISNNLGIHTASYIWNHCANPQAVFLANHFFLANNHWLKTPHRIGFSYFHGLPNTGDKGFDNVYDGLCHHHERISRIQVSHSEMRNAVLQTGINSEKIHLIPIGINLSLFHYHDKTLRLIQRRKIGIPDNSFVVGSFQKDGNGWGEGLEPKLIKGPDIFLEAIAKIKLSIPELFVLLTGPARGYIKAGLDKLNVPYRHLFLKSYPEIGRLYPALDVYLITSRQEGGPKAVLESMASGIPLVTTRVGQAMDLLNHEKNGWMVNSEDVSGIAHWVNYIYQRPAAELEKILFQARLTAEANSYTNQIHLWRSFMAGFVDSFPSY